MNFETMLGGQTKAWRQPHPSNILSHGGAGDFRHAMQLVIEQCEREKVEFLRLAHDLSDDEFEAEDMQQAAASCDDLRAAAQEALELYNHDMREAEKKTFALLSRSNVEDVCRIGQAALAGDYSTLAI